MIVSLDANIVIDALRSRAAFPGFQVFGDPAEDLAMSSVVVSEIVSGARTPRARREIEEGPVGRLLREAAVEAPNVEDWIRTGRLLAEHPEWSRTVSRQNDVLLATQCARQGWVLVTRDADFVEIARYVSGLRLAPPRPF